MPTNSNQCQPCQPCQPCHWTLIIYRAQQTSKQANKYTYTIKETTQTDSVFNDYGLTQLCTSLWNTNVSRYAVKVAFKGNFPLRALSQILDVTAWRSSTSTTSHRHILVWCCVKHSINGDDNQCKEHVSMGDGCSLTNSTVEATNSGEATTGSLAFRCWALLIAQSAHQHGRVNGETHSETQLRWSKKVQKLGLDQDKGAKTRIRCHKRTKTWTRAEKEC